MSTTQPAAERKPLTEDIPTDVAWRQGRRIYVRCGYGTQLAGEMRALGAKWDREVRAQWVGSTKAPGVVPAVEAHVVRKSGFDEHRRTAARVTIPFDAEDVRAEAKRLGATWDSQSKIWLVPAEHGPTVREAVAAYEAAVTAERSAAARARNAQRGAEPATARQVEHILDLLDRAGGIHVTSLGSMLVHGDGPHGLPENWRDGLTVSRASMWIDLLHEDGISRRRTPRFESYYGDCDDQG